MPTFSQGDVVRVPFPYVERPVVQRRPAVVVSDGEVGSGDVPLIWVVMVTSVENAAWPGDISLARTHHQFGLPHPCVIRPVKIATLQTRDVDRIGALDAPTLAELLDRLASLLGAAEAVWRKLSPSQRTS